jgi:hypothetical protein
MFCGGQDGVRRARAHRGHEVNKYVIENAGKEKRIAAKRVSEAFRTPHP